MKKVVFREEIEKNILCFREKSAVYISVFRDIIKKNMEKGGCIWFLSVKYTISFWMEKIIGRGICSIAGGSKAYWKKYDRRRICEK